MRKDLLEFLFGEQAVKLNEPDLGENIVRMFEEADDAEGVQMVANKKPLESALKAIGISGTVDPDYQMAEVRFTDEDEYREATRLLNDPESIHKLAELGWVATRGDGDIAMTNEPPEYKLNFIEISTAGEDSSDSDKAPDLEKIRKQSQKFAVDPVDRSDKMNPVENTRSVGKGKKQAGVGKAKDGADPEGKPKGSTKKTESVDDLLKAPDLSECDECNCKSTKKQAPFFRTDKNLGKKKRGVSEATMASGVPPVMEPPLGIGKTWQARSKKRREPIKKEKTD